jgi:hypothetical protein
VVACRGDTKSELLSNCEFQTTKDAFISTISCAIVGRIVGDEVGIDVFVSVDVGVTVGERDGENDGKRDGAEVDAFGVVVLTDTQQDVAYSAKASHKVWLIMCE